MCKEIWWFVIWLYSGHSCLLETHERTQDFLPVIIKDYIWVIYMHTRSVLSLQMSHLLGTCVSPHLAFSHFRILQNCSLMMSASQRIISLEKRGMASNTSCHSCLESASWLVSVLLPDELTAILIKISCL